MPPRTYRMITVLGSGEKLIHLIWSHDGQGTPAKYVAGFNDKELAETFLDLCKGGWDARKIIELGIAEAQTGIEEDG